MATPNLNCILQAVLAVQNNLISPTPQIATVDLGNPTYPGKVFFYEPFFQATTGGSAVPIPPSFSNVFLVIIQNISPTANIQVQVTPQGQSQTTFSYGPSGAFIYIDPAGIGGISALTVVGVGGTVPVSVVVAV